jgi:hypothetical protein
MKSCSNCGAVNHVSAKHCIKCGVSLFASQVELVALEDDEYIYDLAAIADDDSDIIALDDDEYLTLQSSSSALQNPLLGGLSQSPIQSTSPQPPGQNQSHHKSEQTGRWYLYSVIILISLIGSYFLFLTDDNDDDQIAMSSKDQPIIISSQTPVNSNSESKAPEDIKLQSPVAQNPSKSLAVSFDSTSGSLESNSDPKEAERRRQEARETERRRQEARETERRRQEARETERRRQEARETERRRQEAKVRINSRRSKSNDAWYCLCYDERSNPYSNNYRLSTACRQSLNRCEKLSYRIVHGTRLMKSGENFRSCTRVGKSNHPSDLLTGIGGQFNNWKDSQYPGAFWSDKGCLIE